MRLHHRDYLAFCRLARRMEHGLDFNRVVAVIVEYLNAAHRAGVREAPLDAAEGGNAFSEIVRLDTQLRGTAIAAVAFETL